MNLDDAGAFASSIAERVSFRPFSSAANWDEDSCLERLVAELLLKNQILRFELFHTQEQLELRKSILRNLGIEPSVSPTFETC